jgi:hypothetical protein
MKSRLPALVGALLGVLLSRHAAAQTPAESSAEPASAESMSYDDFDLMQLLNVEV